MIGDMDEKYPTQPHELEIVLYTPPRPDDLPVPVRRRRPGIPKWERLTDQLGSPTQRLEAEDCLQLFPPCSGGTALDIAKNLASGLSPNKEERLVSEFVLLSLCASWVSRDTLRQRKLTR